MKLVWIGTFVLLFASLASLVSGGQSRTLLQQTWFQTSSVIPEPTMAELERTTPLYTTRLFASVPQPFREKLAQKMWSAVELMTFRSLVLLHLAPALLLPLLLGFIEGWWSRTNQRKLIKIHSPMRFSFAVTGLALIPILSLIWLTAPMAIPAVILVFVVGVFAVSNTRNLIVHAPTQF